MDESLMVVSFPGSQTLSVEPLSEAPPPVNSDSLWRQDLQSANLRQSLGSRGQIWRVNANTLSKQNELVGKLISL